MGERLPRIDILNRPVKAQDLVVLAHGGGEVADGPTHDWHPGLLRVLRFASVVEEAAPSVAVGLLRYRIRGWNGERADPAADLLEVLNGVGPDIERILLIGHSMGGRAVLRATTTSRVQGVLALSPWVPSDEPALPARSAPVVLVTGTEDSETPKKEARSYVRRSRAAGARLGYFEIDGAGHSLLLHAKEADHLIRSFLAYISGDRNDLIARSVSADAERDPDVAPPQKDQWRWISGPADNLLSVLSLKLNPLKHD